MVIATGGEPVRREGPHYAFGAFVGGLVGTLLLALLVRFLYVRFAARGRRLWSPWLFVIAAAIAFVVALGRAGEELSEQASSEDAAEAADLLTRLPAGLSYATVPADQRAKIVSSFRNEVGADADIEARNIRADDGVVVSWGEPSSSSAKTGRARLGSPGPVRLRPGDGACGLGARASSVRVRSRTTDESCMPCARF